MKYLLAVLLSCLTLLSLAQVPLNQRKHNTNFYKNNGVEVTTADSADFIRIVSEPDSGSALYDVKEYYAKSQKIRFSGKTSKIGYLHLQGQGVKYYENGRRKTIANYKEGKLVGTEFDFFPNGQTYMAKEFKELTAAMGTGTSAPDDSVITAVFDSTGVSLAGNGNGIYKRYNNDFSEVVEQGMLKYGLAEGVWKGFDEKYNLNFEETYEHGNLISGIATDSNATVLTYKKRYSSPSYPGGLGKLYEYLGQHITYPTYARRNNIEGTVIIQFVVNRKGSLEDIKVLKSVDEGIDAEAVKVLKTVPHWYPGTAFGKSSRFVYTLPISFSLK